MIASIDARYSFANAVLMILFFFTSVYSLKRESLPADEIEAASMIAHHILDSALWDIVEPFYYQPISVPYGEAGILSQLFPELDLKLPVSEQELSKYIPWDKRNVTQFFKDWPELLYFKPILDFSMNLPVKSGKISLSVDRSGVSGKSSQRVQFMIEPVKCLSAGGRFSLAESNARWKNRKICITPAKWFSFKAGNVTPRADPHGLACGAFGIQKSGEGSVRDNWFYGDTKSWNTLVMDFSINKLINRGGLQTYLHVKESETVAGVTANVLLHECIESQIDIIGMDVKEINDTLMYGLGSIKFKNTAAEAEIEFAVPVDIRPAIPLRVGVNYSREMDKFKVELVYFPEGFFGPLSNLLEDFVGRDSILTPANSDLLSSEMAWKHQVTGNTIVIPSLTLKLSDYLLMYLNPGISFSICKNNTSFSVEYQRFEYLHTEKTINSDYLRVDWSTEFFTVHDLNIDCCARHFSDNSWYLSTALMSKFQILPEICIKPGIKYQKYIGKTYELAVSMAYTMSLFDAIDTDCSIEKYVSLTKKQGPLRLNAKMSFVF